MIRRIYVYADHRDAVFTDSEHYDTFHQTSALLHTACHLDPDMLGAEDITIAGDMVASFKARLLASLEEKISALQPDKQADVRIRWGNSTIRLNERNSEHNIILHLLTLLEMANIESEKGGAIHFYSLAALDSANNRIARTFKAEKNGIGMAAAFAKFITKNDEYNAIKQEEFEERVQQLIAGGFLRAEENSGDTLIYPTIKTSIIKTI